MQTYPPTQPGAGRRGLFRDLSVATVIGLTGALARKHLDFHLRIPGHTGVGGVAVLISGRLVDLRPGMSAVAGASTGLWSIPVGLSPSPAHHLLLYGSVAALLDLPGPRRLTGTRAFDTAGRLLRFGLWRTGPAVTAKVRPANRIWPGSW